MKQSKTVLTLILVTILLSAVNIYAKEDKTIRVGYYENEVFQEGASEGAVKTGYAYEYYRKLSEYTGWEYEYVYGSYGELYDMLLDGRIDLLAGLAKRDDRLDLIGYPEQPMGNEVFTLVRHDNDPDVTLSPTSVSGKRIGVLKSAIEQILIEYLNSHSIDAEIVPFDDYESLFEAFDTKTVDILAAEGDGAYGREHAEVICIFGTSDYYLCVNKQKPELLNELNEAQTLLSAQEPGYLNTLRNSYYSSSISSHTFSDAEKEWMETHNELRVGYLNNYLPYSDTDKKGSPTGIITDMLPRLCNELSVSDLQISYKGYDNYDDMIEDIRKEEIDAAFPVGGGLYYSEESGIYQSSSVVSSTTELVYADEYDESDTVHFAVNENNRMQYYYIRSNFPDAQITLYPDIDSCLEAVLNGDAGATTLNGLRASSILKNSRYRGLYLMQLNQTDDRCFGVKIGNEGLLKLINHGLGIMGPEFAQDIAYRYAAELYTYTFSDMVRDNIWLLLSMLLIIALIALFFIKRDLQRTRLSDRMKSDFVSNMSHEIRTPITAILGMNELIQCESNDEKILHYSANIEKAGKSLLGIINDILDFSKIEAGRMEITPAPYSLPELLAELDLMVRLRAGEKGLDFSMEVDEQLPVMPIGDEQKIRQIITNLLSNAVKYTKSGEVRLTLKRVSDDDSGFTLYVAVRDTGIGIRESEMDKLYSAFDRLDMEKTRSIEGSGLGLTITRKMLSLMGSDIRVESEYGKGSLFYFNLHQKISDNTPIGPYEPGKDAVTARRKTATFTAKDARILIVDDTPMNLQVLCGLLKGNAMTVDTADGGMKCLKLFEKNDYDVVYLDHRMPEPDGVETLRLMREQFPEKAARTPVICLTANAFSSAKKQVLDAGFTDYLSKPVTLTQLEETLLKYLPPEKIEKISEIKDDTRSDIPKALADIAELDIQKGLDYCGDIEDYLDALSTFTASSDSKAAKLEGSLSAGDTQNLKLLIHSLKSTSGAIGAMALSEKAAKMEQSPTDEGVSELIHDYRLLNEKLKKAGL